MKKLVDRVKDVLRLNFLLTAFYKKIQINTRVEVLNNLTVNSKESGISSQQYCDHNVVVSLTTYSKRIHEVYLTIESIMQQSLKANRIVLWLSEELRDEHLPSTLRLQEKRGLEIKYCKDIRSYKKLIPSLKLYPDDVIITVDDDVLYNIDVLDTLVRSYLQDPSCIYFCRGHRIKMDRSGSPISYNNWDWYIADYEISPCNFPTGVGGVLYPPHIFNEEVFHEEVFFSICKYADDVWFKAMSLYNGKQSRKVFTKDERGEDYLETGNMQDIALGNINNEQGLNDKQIKAVFDKYDLYDCLVEDKSKENYSQNSR